MPPWKETALEMLPELSDAINAAETPYRLWFDLHAAFEQAYDASPRNESLIGRIYEFHHWCADAPRGETAADDLLTCVVVCFVEHIPQHPAARADMPRWFSYQDFIGAEQVFRYHLSEQEFLDLKQLFYRNREKYVQRPSAKRRNA